MYRCTRGTTTVSLEQYRQFVVRNMPLATIIAFWV
jgi:hypothetical protein